MPWQLSVLLISLCALIATMVSLEVWWSATFIFCYGLFTFIVMGRS
jgi:hypothetical protein